MAVTRCSSVRVGTLVEVMGLPDSVSACLFDVDGVLTPTALVHRRAWKRTFDDFLRGRDGDDFQPFTDDDYFAHVDGKPRAAGVRDFLSSRDITLPEGKAEDASDADTIAGVGKRKNDLFLETLKDEGVAPYPGSLQYLKKAHAAGLKIAAVTSSANGESVLETAGLSQYVQVRIDGKSLAERDLAGKPAPDSFLAAAADLGVKPEEAAVFEDALSGVEAGRAGKFGLVVGVNRDDQGRQLQEHGADVVVADLADLLDEG